MLAEQVPLASLWQGSPCVVSYLSTLRWLLSLVMKLGLSYGPQTCSDGPVSNLQWQKCLTLPFPHADLLFYMNMLLLCTVCISTALAIVCFSGAAPKQGMLVSWTRNVLYVRVIRFLRMSRAA